MKKIDFIKYTLAFFICWAAISNGFGQYISVFGRFESNYIKGCASFKVVLTETDTFPANTVRQYDFTGDLNFVGFEPGEEISYTYSDPGIYQIVQLIGVDITPKTDTLTINVYENIEPVFNIFTCENNGAKIIIADDQYDQHKIFYTPIDSIIINSGQEVPSFIYPAGNHFVTVKGLLNDGSENCAESTSSFNTIDGLLPASLNEVRMLNKDKSLGKIRVDYKLPPDVIYELQVAETLPFNFQQEVFLPNNSSFFSLDSIDTQNINYLLRIAAYDACQQKYLYSDTMSTITISAIAENNQNRIEWKSFPVNFQAYNLIRNNSILEVLPDRNTIVNVDKAVVCYNTYCYSIQLENQGGGLSYSDTVCVESYKIYFPPPVRTTTTSISDSTISLTWIPVDGVETLIYFIQKQIDKDVFATIDTTGVLNYSDQDVAVDNKPYCYSINYLDECRNRSNIGDLSCSIFLKLENKQVLSWTDYIGWPLGVADYIVEEYSENLELLNEYNVGKENVFEISDYIKSQVSLYRVRAESNDNPSLTAFSNFVVKEIESILWVPNSFTPNGDGLNDFFRPEGTLMKTFKMRIFTQAGSLVFETVDQFSGWDGNLNGEKMPAVSYIYIIEASDIDDKQYNQNGVVVLIRQ